ncbi:MAG: hypothetical protein PHR12_06975, partial [Victivallaceae bacterium]|nr:hypothetical protein [Victivallaceae bacterium]
RLCIFNLSIFLPSLIQTTDQHEYTLISQENTFAGSKGQASKRRRGVFCRIEHEKRNQACINDKKKYRK